MAANIASRASEMLDWTQAQAYQQFHRLQTQAQAHLNIGGHGVKPVLPHKSLFRFPPSNVPAILQPPLEGPNFEHSFSIPVTWYNAALDPKLPITFAIVYAITITYLNSVNRRRKFKPWAISQTYLFTIFVLCHNHFLSLYSLWTFLGMMNALRVSVVNPWQEGIVATVDSLCKIHGPRGLGSAATFDPTAGTWGIKNKAYRLASDGINPDSADVGRIWNEGLAFYGWIFYISKFYEVIDTLIIIAKGKKSSFLQTYHHAGAMLCMWAGIRYMSPPIWMFVTVNSFIHFVMYAFYTVTTVNIRVPKPLKQILTTMQITQFVVGASYAFAHYFVAYQVPISVPYIVHFGEVIAEAATAVKSDASSALSVATATASADLGSWLKKLALRAAGREGMAENVENKLGQTFGVEAVRAAEQFVRRQETRYRDEVQWVNCLDTSGESFAIYINIFYLLPLTWLFLRFFIKSYLQRVEQRRRSSTGQRAIIAGKSISDAKKGVARRLSEAFEDYQGANGGSEGPGDLVTKADESATLGQSKLAQDNNQVIDDKAQDSTVQTSPNSDTISQQQDTEPSYEKSADMSDANDYIPLTASIKSEQPSSSTDLGKSTEDTIAEMQPKVEEVKDVAQEPVAQPVTQEDEQEKEDDEGWSVMKSVEHLTDEEITSSAADNKDKVKEEADKVKVAEAAVGIDQNGDSKKAASMKEGERDSDTQDGTSPTKDEPELNPKPRQIESSKSEHVTSGSKESKQTAASDTQLLSDKAFAHAAAKGLSVRPPEPIADAEDVSEKHQGASIKSLRDRKDSLDQDSEIMPFEISEAMSSTISPNPSPSLTRSQSSASDSKPSTTASTPPTTPSRSWHARRRGGRYWSSSIGGDREADIKSSPTLSPVMYR